jgi:hypothetical protein
MDNMKMSSQRLCVLTWELETWSTGMGMLVITKAVHQQKAIVISLWYDIMLLDFYIKQLLYAWRLELWWDVITCRTSSSWCCEYCGAFVFKRQTVQAVFVFLDCLTLKMKALQSVDTSELLTPQHSPLPQQVRVFNSTTERTSDLARRT